MTPSRRQYEPQYWYWEVIVIIEKMLLTGVMSVVGVGSSSQLLIAAMLVLFYLLLVLRLGPFADDYDDGINFMMCLQLLLTLMGGLLIMTDNPNARTYPDDKMGSLLIGLNVAGVAIFFMSLLLLVPCVRRIVDKCLKKEKELMDKVLEAEERVRHDLVEGAKSRLAHMGHHDDQNSSGQAQKKEEQALEARTWGGAAASQAGAVSGE